MINSNQKIALIGGCGFVGSSLATKLLLQGYRVLLVDIQPCPDNLLKKCEYNMGSATDKDFLIDVFTRRQPDVAILIASWGMSGVDMLDRKCFETNVLCATQLVKACVECNIPKVIYTSSYNVVFGGQEIVNGDETLPPFPIEQHSDCYSASKYMAEDYILKANDTKLKKGGHLTTCSLRPAAIYGEGEQRHFPKIIRYFDRGFFLFRIGKATVDWIHIDNLTLAYLMTIQKLLSNPHIDQTDPVLGGQSYFVSDGCPIENFEFLKPLCLARGSEYPYIVISTKFLEYLARILEFIYRLSKQLQLPSYVKKWCEPILIRAEVYKVGITHYCSIDKARRDFGYKPLFDSFQGAAKIAIYYGNDLTNKDFFRFAPTIVWIMMFGFVMQSFITGYSISEWLSEGVIKSIIIYIDNIGLFLVPYRFVYLMIFWMIFIGNATEAVYAYYIALSMGCDNTAVWWTLQTFFAGYGSLMYLFKRQNFLKNLKTKQA